MDRRHRVVLGATGADDELADPVRTVPDAQRVHRREAFVLVVVADERDVHAMAVQQLPERARMRLVVAVGTGRDKRVVHDRDGASARLLGERGPQPVEMAGGPRGADEGPGWG